MYHLRRRSRLMNGDEKLPVLRPGEVVYRDGKPVKRDYRQFRVLANVQPLGDRELLLVPEGDRQKEQFKLFSQDRDEALTLNDLVLRRGKVYVVHGVETWGGYTKSRIVRYDGSALPLAWDTAGLERWALP